MIQGLIPFLNSQNCLIVVVLACWSACPSSTTRCECRFSRIPSRWKTCSSRRSGWSRTTLSAWTPSSSGWGSLCRSRGILLQFFRSRLWLRLIGTLPIGYTRSSSHAHHPRMSDQPSRTNPQIRILLKTAPEKILDYITRSFRNRRAIVLYNSPQGWHWIEVTVWRRA